MPRKMYHISKVDLGEYVTLEPRLPDSADGNSEGNKLRVCFSPSVAQCLHSLHSGKDCTEADVLEEFIPGAWKPRITNPAVYVTQRVLVKPPSVSDFELTGEHWSLRPINVKRIGYVDIRGFMLQDRKLKCVPISQACYSKFSLAEFKIFTFVKRSRLVLRCAYEEFYAVNDA